MTWLEPLWLAYPTAVLAILTFMFAMSVRWTLKAHPVPVLNYAYEPRYARANRTPAPSLNYGQIFAASAAAVYIPMTRGQIMHKRAVEYVMWGHLPPVGS